MLNPKCLDQETAQRLNEALEVLVSIFPNIVVLGSMNDGNNGQLTATAGNAFAQRGMAEAFLESLTMEAVSANADEEVFHPEQN